MTDSKFLRSSIILITANAAAKILGAVFKIPLTYILREDGMAVYNTAFSVYITVMTLALGGFPFALTKLLAEYNAIGKTDRIRPSVRSVGGILLICGCLASAAMYIFAPFFAAAMREPHAADAIRAVAPAIAPVALGAAYKSCNEATSDLVPTAVSQVLEAALKLFIGYYLAKMLIDISVTKSAVGAISGVTVGEYFATILLGTVWFFRTRKYPQSKISSGDISAVCRIAFPLALCGAASSALSMCFVPIMRNALSAIHFNEYSAQNFMLHYCSYTDVFDSLPQLMHLTQDGVRKLYGAYSGYAHTLFNLPVGIIGTISAASTPMLASALTHHNTNMLGRAVERILSLILFLGVPAAFLCFFFSSEILTLLFNTDFAAPMLSMLAPAIIFVCISNMFAVVLHLSGRIFLPFAASSVCTLLQLLLCAFLTRISVINILGAPISCTIACILSFIANSVILKCMFNLRFHFFRHCCIPFAAACVMCAVIFCTLPPFAVQFGKTLGFAAASCIGALCYLAVSFLLSRCGGNIVIGSKK